LLKALPTGYYLMLAPLSVGEHAIRIRARDEWVDEDGVAWRWGFDVVYTLTVSGGRPGHGSKAMDLSANAGGTTINWDSVPGETYRVWWTDVPGVWEPANSMALASGEFTEPAVSSARQYSVSIDE
jgi:hypothetical protein